jgi:hypothetical protein
MGLSVCAHEPDRTRSAPFGAGLSTGWISYLLEEISDPVVMNELKEDLDLW